MLRCVGHLLFGLIFLLFFSGCSAVRLGYGNADSLVRWWIDQYVDMSADQDVLARERLGRLHEWHRTTQLAGYILVLQKGQKLVEGPATAGDFLLLSEDIVRRARVVAAQSTSDVADFLATIKPGQVERMAARFVEKNTDYSKEYRLGEDGAAQRKARYKRMLERTDYWLGDVSNHQKEALAQLIDSQSLGNQFWYEERLRRQREWLDLVRWQQREHPSREELIRQLHVYIARFEMPSDPARLDQAQKLRKGDAELAAKMLAAATPAQRAYAQHKLEDFIRDLSELSQGIR